MAYPAEGNSSLRALIVLFAVCMPLAWGQAGVPQGAAAPAQSERPTEAPKFAIGPGDVLSVQIFDTPELSTDSARVGQDGQVSVPVLGPVPVAGLNVEQAARKIESELQARGIMISPQVTVVVVEYTSQGATLLGEVRTPGVYPTFGGRHLLDLLAMAGGMAPSAGKIVTIAHRSDPTHPVTIHLVVNAEQLGQQENPVIEPGDTIMVGRAGIVYILGAVTRPGGYLVDNNEHISLMEALTLAGGWAQTAALSKARLIRKVPEGHKEMMLDLKHVLNGQQADVYVENGDILFIPVSFGKTLGYRGMEAAIAAAQTAVVYTNGG
jgi:polysaccharide export outer membrane protein